VCEKVVELATWFYLNILQKFISSVRGSVGEKKNYFVNGSNAGGFGTKKDMAMPHNKCRNRTQ
jgi:hypothetical protein